MYIDNLTSGLNVSMEKKVLFVDTCIIEKKTLWVNILVDIESSSFVFL